MSSVLGDFLHNVNTVLQGNCLEGDSPDTGSHQSETSETPTPISGGSSDDSEAEATADTAEGGAGVAQGRVMTRGRCLSSEYSLCSVVSEGSSEGEEDGGGEREADSDDYSGRGVDSDDYSDDEGVDMGDPIFPPLPPSSVSSDTVFMSVHTHGLVVTTPPSPPPLPGPASTPTAPSTPPSTPTSTSPRSPRSPRNDRDPLTLEPLLVGRVPDLVWKFRPSPDSRIAVSYNIHSLVTYYKSSARLTDPVTSIPLTPGHVADLEHRAAAAGIATPPGSLGGGDDRDRAEETREAALVMNFESMGGEIVAHLLDVIEGHAQGEASSTGTSGSEGDYYDDYEQDGNDGGLGPGDGGRGGDSGHTEGDVNLGMAMTLSQLDYIVSEYKRHSVEKTFFFLQQAESFLRGPEKRPTRHNQRFQAVLSFLHGLWTAADAQALKAYRTGVEVDLLSASPPSVTGIAEHMARP